jgi:amidophosphoribosyltransferase
MITTNPFEDRDGDKLREECGIFGVLGARDAAAMTALGLHALQHRGQEAVGITSFDGQEFFPPWHRPCRAELFQRPGDCRTARHDGSGPCPLFHHRRFGPAQRAAAVCRSGLGGFAIAHNGNISNAMFLKRDLVQKGAIFQSTSDTEVIIHLVATSRYPTLLDRFVDALRLVEGAYSLICMTPEGMIACRDPLGIRPLVMGKLGDAVVFASESVALDVVGADMVREVEAGELIQVALDGSIQSHRPLARRRSAPAFRARLFQPPGLGAGWPLGL